MQIASKRAAMRAFAAAGFLISVTTAEALACTAPPGFAETPPPRIEARRLVAHTEEITIARPLSQVIAEAEATSLEEAVGNSGALPTVSGTRVLTEGGFGGVGSRRLVCLSDGSALLEEVIELRSDAASRRFRYVVWGYTTAAARPISYGVGDFLHTDVGGAHMFAGAMRSRYAATVSRASLVLSAIGCSACFSLSAIARR